MPVHGCEDDLRSSLQLNLMCDDCELEKNLKIWLAEGRSDQRKVSLQEIIDQSVLKLNSRCILLSGD